MEAKLRISEETYRNLFHNAQVGLFRSRISDGAILEANHQIAEMFVMQAGVNSWRNSSRLITMWIGAAPRNAAPAEQER